MSAIKKSERQVREQYWAVRQRHPGPRSTRTDTLAQFTSQMIRSCGFSFSFLQAKIANQLNFRSVHHFLPGRPRKIYKRNYKQKESRNKRTNSQSARCLGRYGKLLTYPKSISKPRGGTAAHLWESLSWIFLTHQRLIFIPSANPHSFLTNPLTSKRHTHFEPCQKL